MKRFIVPGSRTLSYRLHHINNTMNDESSASSILDTSYTSLALIASIIGLFYLVNN